MKIIWLDSDIRFLQRARGSLPDQMSVELRTTFNPEEVEGIIWHSIDLLIMELLVSKHETLDLVPVIRKKHPELKILIVTSHATKDRCIRAINLGINGLIEKPLDLQGFAKRVEDLVEHPPGLQLDQDRKSVFSGNQWVDLTRTEYRILEALKSAQKRLTREELQKRVWPGSALSQNNLDTHLSNLKKKIPELNKQLSIKRGLGYFLNLKRK